MGWFEIVYKGDIFFVVYREQPHFQTHHDSSCFVGCHTHLIFACNKLAPQRAVANNEDSHIHNLSLVISQCLTALICIDLHWSALLLLF